MRVKIKKPKAVLLDIEGTITAIDFVRITLFSFVRENLEEYLQNYWLNDEMKADIRLLRDEAIAMKKNNVDIPLIVDELANDDEIKASIVKNVLWQMDRNLKSTSLKQLQGHIWRVGFENGLLKGHFFDDVLTMLPQWKHSLGITFYIYSSGSVESQKLLMAHTVSGELQSVSAVSVRLEYRGKSYFDTKVGAKIDSQSYANILNEIQLNGDDVLFMTDIPTEADAASKCGINCILVVREGNAPLDEETLTRFKTLRSFEELDFV
ncbi:enolase-phosphatase E1-like protein [Leptotrombidium deliense]|uniref:Enolase-phosphatase E1-like protein n=1 Tax=Leptotrombidium deliense TaxID=299467 RepID=A0A443SPV9_9ACAR|nr:enolase-phosphatase E1-like protein [Leptotrombidium deliense]